MRRRVNFGQGIVFPETDTNKLLKYPSNLADHGLISGWQDCDSGGPNVIFDGSRYKICATTNAYNEVTPSIYNATPFELIVDKNYSPKTN